MLAFTLVVSLFTGILFGLAPAWRATNPDLATIIKHGRRASGAVSRLSKGLVVLQVTLSLLVLIGAGLYKNIGIWHHTPVRNNPIEATLIEVARV